MRPNQRLEQNPFILAAAQMMQTTQRSMEYAGMPRGTIRGTVVDVDDPEERGRVRVIFDDMNPDIPQVLGTDYAKEREGEKPDKSHWIDVSPAFKGKQPEGLKGKRVNISVSNGQYQYAVLQDVLYDPDTLAQKAQKKLKIPNNSSMTRLPLYKTGKLPPATEENHGCMVIELGGPMDSDWLCVCLKRQGEYYWVRHIDMAHGHAGENDGKQPSDSEPNNEQPVEEQAIWDYVFPTTGGEMQKYSRYGTSPRSNPFGGEAKWYEPPKTESSKSN
jgi:hypothetical protein